MEHIISVSEESNYNEILQQPVAVIEAVRNKVARSIVGTSNEMHWEVGKIRPHMLMKYLRTLLHGISRCDRTTS